jgi:hypothetical protein
VEEWRDPAKAKNNLTVHRLSGKSFSFGISSAVVVKILKMVAGVRFELTTFGL